MKTMVEKLASCKSRDASTRYGSPNTVTMESGGGAVEKERALSFDSKGGVIRQYDDPPKFRS